MSDLILKYAEDGDEVIISEKDKNRLSSEWLKGLSEKVSLSLSSCFHNDEGGIILRGKKYDKNLTVSSIIAEVRNLTAATVAKRLFN